MSRGFKFEIGEMARDKVTNYEGFIISRAEHISGCDTYGMQPQTLRDGMPQDPKWFDEPRIESTGKSLAIVDERPKERRTGADTIPQSTRMDP